MASRSSGSAIPAPSGEVSFANRLRRGQNWGSVHFCYLLGPGVADECLVGDTGPVRCGLSGELCVRQLLVRHGRFSGAAKSSDVSRDRVHQPEVREDLAGWGPAAAGGRDGRLESLKNDWTDTRRPRRVIALILKPPEHMGMGGSMQGLQKLAVAIDGMDHRTHLQVRRRRYLPLAVLPDQIVSEGSA